MSRRWRLREPRLLEVVVDVAWASPLLGAAVSVGLLIAALAIQSVRPTDFTAWSFLCPIIALILAMVGAGGFLVSALAFLRDAVFGRR